MPMLNVADFVKIGLMAFIFIWLANRALSKVGMDQYKV